MQLLIVAIWLLAASRSFLGVAAKEYGVGIYTNTTLLWAAKPDFQELITPKGYPLEEHQTVTSDGYVLTLYRILRKTGFQASPTNKGRSVVGEQLTDRTTAAQVQTSLGRQSRSWISTFLLPSGSSNWVEGADGEVVQAYSGPRGPVLLQHGLLDCSATWVNNDPDKSLAFILADQGYDVWLGNARGTTWSREHMDVSSSSQEYWDFSFDEMAMRDIPAMVEHVLKYSGWDTLEYVCHSQGCTTLLGALATAPSLNSKIRRAGLLAPAVFATNISNQALQLLAQYDVADLFTFFGVKEFLPATSNQLFSAICSATPGLCSNILALICGYNPDNIDQDKLQEFLLYTPAGTSVRNMAHWTQRLNAPRNDTFTMYDFGTKCTSWLFWTQDCNPLMYGQDEPPEYQLANVAIPLSIYSGGVDVLATPPDVELLLQALPRGTVVASREMPTYGHLDFVWGEHTHTEIYDELLAFLMDDPGEPPLRAAGQSVQNQPPQ